MSVPSAPEVPAQTVGRAVQLLRIIASSQARDLKLIDIAAMASLDKSTAQRLLNRLVHERLLARDSARGYRLGPLLYELGLAAFPETNLREVSQDVLHELAQTTGDMVFLVVRSGTDTVCLNRIAGNYPIQTMTRTVGDRHPLGVGAGGLAILAAMHDADIDTAINAIEPRLHAYQLTRDSLWAAVEKTRAHGDIAIDEGNAALDVTAIGRVIRDRSHTPIAAIFVATISHRMAPERKRRVIQKLVGCAKTIEDMLLN